MGIYGYIIVRSGRIPRREQEAGEKGRENWAPASLEALQQSLTSRLDSEYRVMCEVGPLGAVYLGLAFSCLIEHTYTRERDRDREEAKQTEG